MIFSELIDFLTSLNTRPKKSLSQNFLIDPNIVQKILRLADIKPKETILEIGPGAGALTKGLLDAGARVIAVEKDRLLSEKLGRLQTTDSRLSVHSTDILQFPIPSRIKFVANLPYHITTPILERILLSSFSSCTIMIQKEMADRLLAKPGCKEFSSLSLFLQFYGKITDNFTVSSHCFYPKPKVHSTVLKIEPSDPPLCNPDPFFQLIRKAFQQRRKMMSSSLKEVYSPEMVQQTLVKIGKRKDSRPEMLSLEDWVQFYLTLESVLQ